MMIIDDEVRGEVITEIQYFWDFTAQGILLKFSPTFSNSEKKFSKRFELRGLSCEKGIKITLISGFVYTSLTFVSQP